MTVDTFTYTPSETIDFAKGKVLRNVEIFKAGVFKGRKWTKDQLEQIVSNFKVLRESAGLEPPVRLGHRSDNSVDNVKSIVGYFDDLRLGENKAGEAVIVADLDITDDQFLKEVKKGKYRKKSIEIGPYEDNQGNKYDVAVWGLGIVDIPAVENLNELEVNVYSQALSQVTTLSKEQYDALIVEAEELSKVEQFTDHNVGKVKKAIASIAALLDDSVAQEDWYDVSELANYLSMLKAKLPVQPQGAYPMSKHDNNDIPEESPKSTPSGEEPGATSGAEEQPESDDEATSDTPPEGDKPSADEPVEDHDQDGSSQPVQLTADQITEYETLKAEKIEFDKTQAKERLVRFEASFESLIKAGKIPAGDSLQKMEHQFFSELSDSQKESYLTLKEASPAIIGLGEVRGKQGTKNPDSHGFTMNEAQAKAVEKAKENMRLHLSKEGWKTDDIENYLKEHTMGV